MSGAVAELLIKSQLIEDNSFRSRMTAASSVKVLDQGTRLLAYFATKDKRGLSDTQKKCLIPWESKFREIATSYIDSWSSGGLSLVEVSIGDPTQQQAKKFDSQSGGLWLLIEGRKTVGLQSSQICMPTCVSEEPTSSLNHAFTRLSEVFEPWRISHTGNVYQRFLYKEANGIWYPLEFLRNAALAKNEEAIAVRLWQDFLARMAENAPRASGEAI